MATATDKPLLLNSRDAAKQLCISTRTLWSLQASGEVPHVKIGGAVRFAPADLIAYIERNKVNA